MLKKIYKKGQEEMIGFKSKFPKGNFGFMKWRKRAQEEMVGFALIIIIVAVVLLVFLGYYIRNSETSNVESYEVESFIQTFLHYTTDCADNYEPRYYSIERLISACKRSEKCSDERETCEVLDQNLRELSKEAWQVSEDSPVKGYNMKISSNDEIIIEVGEGNSTNEYKSSFQELGRENIEISFSAYY